MASTSGTVLVVDDDPSVADMFAALLRERYSVRVAYSGTEGLASLDDDVDVVLLDRRMPGLTGDEVLERIRGRGLDCRVAMVTAVEPDMDIVEMGFDDYLVKPVSQEDLHEVTERLRSLARYDSTLREFYSLCAKRAALLSETSTETREADDRFGDLERRIAQLRREVDETLAGLDAADALAIALDQSEDDR